MTRNEMIQRLEAIEDPKVVNRIFSDMEYEMDLYDLDIGMIHLSGIHSYTIERDILPDGTKDFHFMNYEPPTDKEDDDEEFRPLD